MGISKEIIFIYCKDENQYVSNHFTTYKYYFKYARRKNKIIIFRTIKIK